MSVIANAVVLAEEATQGGGVPPWVFGVTAFVGLAALLIVALMIKVGR